MFEDIQPISITERAATEIKKIMATKNIPVGYGLRVGIKGGGCGAQLIIGFDKKKSTDKEYLLSEIPVYIDKSHTLYIMGKSVDYYEGSDEQGFMFTDDLKK